MSGTYVRLECLVRRVIQHPRHAAVDGRKALKKHMIWPRPRSERSRCTSSKKACGIIGTCVASNRPAYDHTITAAPLRETWLPMDARACVSSGVDAGGAHTWTKPFCSNVRPSHAGCVLQWILCSSHPCIAAPWQASTVVQRGAAPAAVAITMANAYHLQRAAAGSG